MSDETKCPTCDSIDNAPMRPMRYCENCQNMFPDNNTPTHKAELARLRLENEELKVENNCLKAKIVNRQYAYLDPKPSEDGRA